MASIATVRGAPVAPLLVATSSCCGAFNFTRRLVRYDPLFSGRLTYPFNRLDQVSNLAVIRDNIDVIVVDDGSADDTRAWLRARGVLVLSTNDAAPTVPKGLTAGWNVMVCSGVVLVCFLRYLTTPPV